MTLREFREMSWGLYDCQLLVGNKWVTGNETFDKKYMDMTIAEFDFYANEDKQVICGLVLEEI